MPGRPPSALSRSGSAEIRPMGGGDLGFLRELYRQRENANIAPSAAIDDPDFVAIARADTWSAPMVLLEEDRLLGAAMIAAADTQHRHGRLVVLGREPGRLRTPLGLYLRHAFWSYPLNRVYAVLPARLPAAGGYPELLRSCGFVPEGCLRGHLRAGARMLDLDLFGLLRTEFDDWCQQHRPDWAL